MGAQYSLLQVIYEVMRTDFPQYVPTYRKFFVPPTDIPLKMLPSMRRIQLGGSPKRTKTFSIFFYFLNLNTSTGVVSSERRLVVRGQDMCHVLYISSPSHSYCDGRQMCSRSWSIFANHDISSTLDVNECLKNNGGYHSKRKCTNTPVN